MEKIIEKTNNKLSLDIFINGQILLELIPKEVLLNIVAELEKDISVRFDKKTRKKNKKI